MDFDTFIEKTKNIISANECGTFFCQCEIKYSGRAEAFLPLGDRMIIIKSDNTLLVHQPEGSAPVNYMKEGSKIEIQKKDHHVLIKSKNSKFKDNLEIDIYYVYNFISKRLNDGKKLELEGNEKDMSDMIFKNPNLISDDFTPLSREEHTNFGFIDVFGHNKNGELVIIECKRYTAGLSCVTQLRRYVEKIKSLKGIEKVTGIMAAPKISPNSLKMLSEWGFNFISINPPMRLIKYEKDQKSLVDF